MRHGPPLWRVTAFLMLVLACSPLLLASEKDASAADDNLTAENLHLHTYNPPKKYFHSYKYACDGDCHNLPCWADADGRPVSRRILVKTNIPAWGMLWQNVAAEIDIIPHFSFELPFYWSPYNYGKHDLKFRVLSSIPKFRYWLSPDNDGFFLDVHGGFAYYNVAFDKDHRYQDHEGRRPAMGGGIGVGYRFRLPNPRWKIETAIGFGIYSLDYDVFSYSHKGMIVDRKMTTFHGIDNFAVSVSYEFYLRPRKNKIPAALEDFEKGGVD